MALLFIAMFAHLMRSTPIKDVSWHRKVLYNMLSEYSWQYLCILYVLAFIIMPHISVIFDASLQCLLLLYTHVLAHTNSEPLYDHR